MAKLSSLLSAKIKAADLNFTAAAKALAVSAPSLRSVLAGRSAPNSRSIGKYAKFLGISEEAVTAASPPRGGGKGGRRPGRTAGKADKPKGKPGRPKLPGVAKATIRLLTQTVDSIQKRINRMNKVIERISKR
jgi:hypothetical protein